MTASRGNNPADGRPAEGADEPAPDVVARVELGLAQLLRRAERTSAATTARTGGHDLDRSVYLLLHALRDGGPQRVHALAERLGASDTVRSFLGVLARQRRMAALPAIIDGFARLFAAHRGEETAQVTSAVALDEAQLGAVRDAVAGYVGRAVQLSAVVDPALLGGLVVRIGSRMVDASLKTKLQNLELSMRGLR